MDLYKKTPFSTIIVVIWSLLFHNLVSPISPVAGKQVSVVLFHLLLAVQYKFKGQELICQNL